MLHQLLRHTLEIAPDRPILECDGSWTTAAELERLTSRLASGLAAVGFAEGDRVALLLPNGLEAVVCYLACFRMRLVIVPLDYQYHPRQIGSASPAATACRPSSSKPSSGSRACRSPSSAAPPRPDRMQ